jgi:hypothetical protein
MSSLIENHILYWSTSRPKDNSKEEMEQSYSCIIHVWCLYYDTVRAVCVVNIVICIICNVDIKMCTWCCVTIIMCTKTRNIFLVSRFI